MLSGEESPGPIEVTIALDDENVERIGDVAERLRAAGLRDPRTQEALGVITGSVDDPEMIGALERVEGVAGVELARRFQLPPPDSPIQ